MTFMDDWLGEPGKVDALPLRREDLEAVFSRAPRPGDRPLILLRPLTPEEMAQETLRVATPEEIWPDWEEMLAEAAMDKPTEAE